MATPADDVETKEALKFCVILLQQECNGQQFSTAIETLLKIFRNVVSHPTEAKYQELRVTNATVSERLWQFTGAQQFLIAAGWTQVEDKVMLFDQQYVRIAVRVLEETSRSSSVPSFQTSQPKSEKEKLLEETRRKQMEQMKREKEERKRIAEQIKADRRETHSRPTTDSVARHLHNNGQIKRFEDIGVDLNKGGGG